MSDDVYRALNTRANAASEASVATAPSRYELFQRMEDLFGKNFNRPVEAYLLAALVYFVICYSLSLVVKRLQSKIAIVR